MALSTAHRPAPASIMPSERAARLHDAADAFSGALRELAAADPRPGRAVLDEAVGALAAALWDHQFDWREIARAFGRVADGHA